MNAQSKDVATRDQNPLIKLNEQLAARAEQFKAVLPSHISVDAFQRTIMTAVQSDPDLLKADRQSLILACMKAAQDKLLPDKREAALVTFNSNRKDAQGAWQTHKEVVYMPMVYGLRKKILQSGEVADITTAVVYKQEVESGRFIYEEGTERCLRHKPELDPSFDPSDDDIALAYSVATFKDGTKSFEVVPRRELNKIQRCSQTGSPVDRKGKPREVKGPWKDWYSEQCRKSALRRHSKSLPQSGDIIDVEAHDDIEYARSAMGALAMAEPDAPTPSDREQEATRLPTASELDHDAETGEVFDDEEDDRAAAEAADREVYDQVDGIDRNDEQPDEQVEDDDSDNDVQEQLAASSKDKPKAKPDGKWKETYSIILEDIVAAQSLADIKEAEAKFVNARATFPDTEVGIIERELTNAKTRLEA